MISWKKNDLILGITVLCALAMSLVDGVLNPVYPVKAALKIVLFLGVPLLCWYRRHPEGLRPLFRLEKRALTTALALGLGVYGILVGGYFLLRGVFDFSGIVDQLATGEGVHAGNFLFVGSYIALVNSLLEEWFFRGFAWLTLRRFWSPRAAFICSAAAFALYHVGMTSGWFHPAFFVLSLAGLFAGGCLFNLLDSRSGSIWPGWLVHFFANAAINTVGCLLMGIF